MLFNVDQIGSKTARYKNRKSCLKIFFLIYDQGHHSVHDIDDSKDQLHHEHTILGFRFKETLMVSTGALTFTGDFLIFLIFLGNN